MVAGSLFQPTRCPLVVAMLGNWVCNKEVTYNGMLTHLLETLRGTYSHQYYLNYGWGRSMIVAHILIDFSYMIVFIFLPVLSCYRQEKEDEELNKPLSRSNRKENQLWVLEKHRGFQESGHLLFAFFGCLHISLSCLRYYIRHTNMLTVLHLSYWICRLVVFLLYYVKVYLDPFVTILVLRNLVTYQHCLMSKGCRAKFVQNIIVFMYDDKHCLMKRIQDQSSHYNPAGEDVYKGVSKVGCILLETSEGGGERTHNSVMPI
uniref:Uncharacterized protein n=1 Tax=Solanum lycopersicum TaxID=4081 RepID=A0A3Q7GBP9_SOLLC